MDPVAFSHRLSHDSSRASMKPSDSEPDGIEPNDEPAPDLGARRAVVVGGTTSSTGEHSLDDAKAIANAAVFGRVFREEYKRHERRHLPPSEDGTENSPSDDGASVAPLEAPVLGGDAGGEPDLQDGAIAENRAKWAGANNTVRSLERRQRRAYFIAAAAVGAGLLIALICVVIAQQRPPAPASTPPTAERPSAGVVPETSAPAPSVQQTAPPASLTAPVAAPAVPSSAPPVKVQGTAPRSHERTPSSSSTKHSSSDSDPDYFEH